MHHLVHDAIVFCWKAVLNGVVVCHSFNRYFTEDVGSRVALKWIEFYYSVFSQWKRIRHWLISLALPLIMKIINVWKQTKDQSKTRMENLETKTFISAYIFLRFENLTDEKCVCITGSNKSINKQSNTPARDVVNYWKKCNEDSPFFLFFLF